VTRSAPRVCLFPGSANRTADSYAGAVDRAVWAIRSGPVRWTEGWSERCEERPHYGEPTSSTTRAGTTGGTTLTTTANAAGGDRKTQV
jgi:hypothetical protein